MGCPGELETLVRHLHTSRSMLVLLTFRIRSLEDRDMRTEDGSYSLPEWLIGSEVDYHHAFSGVHIARIMLELSSVRQFLSYLYVFLDPELVGHGILNTSLFAVRWMAWSTKARILTIRTLGQP